MAEKEPDRVRWRSLALDVDGVLGPWARLAVAALAENMGGKRCFVSQPWLARRMACSERTTRDALAELEREGFLVVERRSGVSSLYRRSLPRQEVPGSPRHEAPHSPARTPAGTPAGTPARRAAEPENQRTREPEDHLTTFGGAAASGKEVVLRTDGSPAQALVAFYVDAMRALGVDPPRRLIGQVAQHVGELIREGQPPQVVAAALRLLIERRLNPATLPSLIPEAVAGPGAASRREHPVDKAIREAFGERER